MVVWTGFVFVLGLIFILRAQEMAMPLQSATTDSIVQLTADAEGLALLSPVDVPRSGTFWWVMVGGIPVPAPCPPLDLSAPIYLIADGQFLVDETGGQVAVNPRRFGSQAQSAGGAVASALASQADEVVNLITRVQTTAANQQMRAMSRAMGMDVPLPGEGGGDGGDGTNGLYSDSFHYTVPTNGLWLEITNVSNGFAWLNLHNATNQVYEIWSKTNLSDAAWNIETELWPTDTNSMPFTIPVLDRNNALFIWARDWTGVTSGGNQTPEWWFWKYFGTVNLSDTNLDSQGNMLLSDYQNGADPNVISFTMRLGNQNFNTTTATGSFLVLAGVPSYEAVLVNDTNWNDAVWQPYDGTVWMNLGPTDGVYQVELGLKGRAADSKATWIGTEVTLTRTKPQIFITNPTTNVVAQPYLQLQGHSALPLAGVTFDISNAVTFVTNQLGSITGHTLDTNLNAFAADYFQCYDLLLTNGLNTITLHATDPAGNTFTTNVNVTLDYSTAANPVIQLTWPQDGMQICQSSFTLRGWTEDASATVTAQITDANGDTNFVTGLVERTGVLWVNNLPLAEGTNSVTLWVMNSAGYSSETNFNVVKSDMTLTLDTINGDLWLPTVSVSGSISAPNYSVWVNGVQGTNNHNGTWNADNVPVSAGGVASFDFKASCIGNDPDGNLNATKPTEVVLDTASWHSHSWSDVDAGLGGAWEDISDGGGYAMASGGIDQYLFAAKDTNFVTMTTNQQIETLAPGLAIKQQAITAGPPTTSANYYNVGSFSVVLEKGTWGESFTNGMLREWDKSSNVKLMLRTGGVGVFGQQVLVAVNASATEESLVSANIPNNQITIPGLGKNLGSDGWAYGTAKSGDSVDVTPTVNVPIYTFTWPNALVYAPVISWKDGPAITNSQNVVVGQAINLTCQLEDTNGNPPTTFGITNYSWTVPGNTFSDYVATAESAVLYKNFPTTSNTVNYYWIDKGNEQVQCTVQAAGQTITANATFNVVRPDVTWTLTPKSHVAVTTDVCDSLFPGYYHLTTGRGCSPDDVGMWYQFQVTDMKGYTNSYTFQFVQVVTIDYKQNLYYPELPDGFKSKYVAGRGLDGAYPYKSWNVSSGVADDTPWDVLIDYIAFDWRRDSFECYLMFTPAGGKPVPLKLATWNWYGRARKVDNNLPPGFVGVPPFTNPQAALGVDCFSHPTWSTNISDLTWTYQYFPYATP